jgi:hypothetical protein
MLGLEEDVWFKKNGCGEMEVYDFADISIV